MKFTAVVALAGLTSLMSVMAAPAPAITAAPAVFKRVPTVAVRNMDPQEAQSIVDNMRNGNGNGNGYNSDDSGDNSNYGGNGMDDAHQYVQDASSSLAAAATDLRQNMNGQVPRPVSQYLKDQSSRIQSASKIANGGPASVTQSASSFVSLASAYSSAQASFTPQAHQIENDIQNGRYNAAAASHMPTILSLAGAVGTVLVWVVV